ncbi:MAG TPA: SMP-30/gluconolactonase/LRE family protein [Polyangiaceae bacterium]|nr:SMP-30/gluconolactonase/LRE family protein [Polyangiaceae bacterium]
MRRSFCCLGFGLMVAACGGGSSNGVGTGGAATTGGALSSGGALASGGTAPATGGIGTGGVGTGGSAMGGSSNGGMPGSGGATGGVSVTSGGTSSGGSSSGGTAGASGASTGGVAGAKASGGAGASGGGGSATGGSATGGSGGASTLWACPSGVTGKPTLSGLVPTRIASVPPSDSFNMNNGTYGNIEGPVWIGDALYMSEMNNTPYDQQNSNVVQSRILKLSSDGNVSIFVADSGSNGLAVDANGNIVAAVHKDGSLTRFTLPSGTPSTVVNMYMGKRFNTPNDLAIRSDGNIYFTDPNFQAPTPLPQGATRVYRRDPSGTVTPLADNFNNPNGITLSLKEDFLYVAASNGRRYPVMADGSLGAGENFSASNGGDGMVIDCAGNLYVAKGGSSNVGVYTPDGTSIGMITVPSSEGIQVTNVAFGGAEHKTLYITGLQNKKGLFKVELDIAGRPY